MDISSSKMFQKDYSDIDFFNKNSIDLSLYQFITPLTKPDIPHSSYLTDSYFNDLTSTPTTQNLYHNTCSLTPKRSFVSQTDSQASVDEKSYTSRSVTSENDCQNDCQSDYSISMSSSIQQYHERISLPAKLYKKDSKKEIRRISSLDSSSFALVQKENMPDRKSVSRLSMATSDKRKKTWLKRILKVFNKNKQHPGDDKNPVWYCQYSKNPISCFENYYKNQPINMI